MSQESFKKSKKKIIAIISALIPEAKIYLYGSRARGTEKEWSDIDIALDADSEIPRLDVGEIRDMLAESNIPYKIDIVDINSPTIGESLKQAILKDKIIWKE